MRSNSQLAVGLLRLAIGVTLLLQALVLAASHGATDAHFGPAGYPPWMRHALAWTEICAAALFLWPRASFTGGALLIVVLLWASALHVALGETPPVSFVVYVAAIFMVMTHSSAVQHARN